MPRSADVAERMQVKDAPHDDPEIFIRHMSAMRAKLEEMIGYALRGQTEEFRKAERILITLAQERMSAARRLMLLQGNPDITAMARLHLAEDEALLRRAQAGWPPVAP